MRSGANSARPKRSILGLTSYVFSKTQLFVFKAFFNRSNSLLTSRRI